MVVLTIASKAAPFDLGLLALATQVNATQPNSVSIEYHDDKTVKAEDGKTACAIVNYSGRSYTTTNAIARLLGRLFLQTELYNLNDPISSTLIDQWLDFCEANLKTNDFKRLDGVFRTLNKHLTLRSYIVGYQASIADFVIWGALKTSPIFGRILKTKKAQLGTYLVRWYEHITSLDAVQSAVNAYTQRDKSTKTKTTDQGKFDIGLTDAEVGKVVTRFPPEPSGYLHIGHAKAALLNQYFAETYKGKLIVRFDDTNPSKEKVEFEDSMVGDLALMGIKATIVTHTSDYFDQMYDLAVKMIKEGKAYVDNTDKETMRELRLKGLPSNCRDLSIEESLRRFDEMKNATEFGLTCCLRAKIKHDDVNGTMRDPVIYRCNLTPHHRTGDKWKIYPTYDFACPIVDSLEGVTHALRTNEYRDRNVQYHWMINALGIRDVTIWDFSRINFVYTLMSKRKLQWFVDQGLVSGWDDPRFPTVRGIRRRGLTIEAMKQYILMQGASQNVLLLEWDKLWALNKKIIDPISPRHVAVVTEDTVKCTIHGAPSGTEVKDVPKHKKNPDVGTKKTVYSSTILLEQEDAKSLEKGEEITLMDWGNAIVRDIHTTGDKVTGIDFDLHLEGDFKKTKKKLTWLGLDDSHPLTDVLLVDYDYIITKKKVEENDDVKDLVTPVSEFKVSAKADNNVTTLRVGDIIQFERKGYYILDQVAQGDVPAHFIRIPDGKTATTSSKA